MEFQLRNKTLTSSMVGALLFGGTLGGASAAQAATVIDNFATGFGGAFTITTQSGAGILGTRQVSNGSGMLLSFANPGMNWNGNAYNYSEVDYSNFGSLDFTNVALTMTGSGSATGTAKLLVTIIDGNGNDGFWNVAFGSSITMSTSIFGATSGLNLADIRSIRLQTGYTGVGGTVNYTMTNFSYSAVPAPGALALLGVAGLAGGRRRRA
jgi:MYXO-CTERM domain-containing protein